MKDHLVTMLKYTIWANEASYESVIKTDKVDVRAYSLLSHIIASQKIWLSRVTDKASNPINPWEQFPHEDMLLLSRQIGEDWIKSVKDCTEENLYRDITYTNSRGEPFKNKFYDIAAHVINHSTYHRGQIAALVKKGGGIPAITDYIVYKREVKPGN